MPKRIQRKRTVGWKMPPGTVYVGRPSRWGNPFAIAEFGEEKALGLFNAWIKGHAMEITPRVLELIEGRERPLLDDLRGKDLACWCSLDRPCHADVLLELANATKENFNG